MDSHLLAVIAMMIMLVAFTASVLTGRDLAAVVAAVALVLLAIRVNRLAGDGTEGDSDDS